FGNFAHRLFPIGSGNFYRRRLHPALNQQSVVRPALRRPGYLASLPQHIKMFRTLKTLARKRLARARGPVGPDAPFFQTPCESIHECTDNSRSLSVHTTHL